MKSGAVSARKKRNKRDGQSHGVAWEVNLEELLIRLRTVDGWLDVTYGDPGDFDGASTTEEKSFSSAHNDRAKEQVR